MAMQVLWDPCSLAVQLWAAQIQGNLTAAVGARSCCMGPGSQKARAKGVCAQQQRSGLRMAAAQQGTGFLDYNL